MERDGRTHEARYRGHLEPRTRRPRGADRGDTLIPNVHKDFHGALSYGIQFVLDNLGEQALEKFLSGLAQTVYRPLVDDIRARGIPALRDYLQHVFEIEDGQFELREQDDRLELRVLQCPAIAHMRENNYHVAHRFCEHTRIVNEAVCRAAGFESNVEYDQENGRCIQQFWRQKI